MKNALLLTENQTHFLQENRQDPITGDDFSIGDEIVFCAECKSAFLKDSWIFMNKRHCNQNKTLKNFPVLQRLLLEKPKVVLHNRAEVEDRLPAFFIDLVLCCFAGFVLIPFLWFAAFFMDNLEYGSVYISAFLFIFRDSILSNKSIGKHTMHLYFINTNTQKNASFYKVMLRNLLCWIVLVPITYLSFVSDSLFVLLITLSSIILYCLFFVTQNQFPIDKLLGIELVTNTIENNTKNTIENQIN